LREAFGDPAAGDFFRVNNLATLGVSEVQLLRQVDTAVQLLVEAETEARQKWLAEEREDLRSKSIQAWQQLQVLDFAVLNGPTLDDKIRISILRLLSQWRLGLQMNLLKPNAGTLIAGKLQIVFLQGLLKTAIAKEDYLAASRIRDRIRILGEAA
jgi:protein-arginine kinase